MKYKIALDVSPLQDGNSVRGVGYYTKNLITALKHEISINPAYKNKYSLDLVTNPSDLPVYHLIHYPYFDPFYLTLPPRNNRQKRLVTVHDLIPLEFKKYFPAGIRGKIKWQIQKHRLIQSDYLITVSHYSKHSIASITNYPEDRIFVTYEAADDSFKPRSQAALTKIKNKYDLPDKFVLYVGDINWNKNLPSLVQACIDLDYPLVLVGSAAVRSAVTKHPWNLDILKTQDYISKHPKQVIATGFVPDDELPLIFNLATIYCQPSFAEGFGLPLIQALQSGTAIAYSQETCLNELLDYHGEIFDPYNLADIKHALSRLWVNPGLRSKYIKEGILRAQKFNWQYTALETLAVYDLCFI